MNGENRPDPDSLLARVEAEERQKALGKLKIFLGYAAGVGKTYSMLEAAHSRRAEGVDLVAALVETHGRGETEALLQGLEIIPRKPVEYRGVKLSEMDLDGVLARKPQLALVDELAHSNAPGSRHPKRWQDIEELLKAGIDVYTTLNIQHLESFRDIIAQITEVVQRETIPDRVLDEASEIEVVDLPPEELLLRLREGKVYIPEQAARAIENFFEPGNLIALREITLRRAANRVDEQMREYLQAYPMEGLWPVTERLLVCISGSPTSQRLIRTARRLGEELKAEWSVLYVETAEDDKLTRENRERVWSDLRLAESLGAKEVSTVKGDSVLEAVIDYARKHQISKIIVGRPTRSSWRGWMRGSVVDQILRKSPKMDVYVVSDAGTGENGKAYSPRSAPVPWQSYFTSLLLVAAASLASGVAFPFLTPINLMILYLLAVVVAALRLGFKPALLTAFLGVLSFDFFFIPPYYSFAVADTEYFITFAGLLIVGAVISTLVARARKQTETIRTREMQTAHLYALSRGLASAVGLQDILNTLIRHVSETLPGQVAIFTPEGESLTLAAGSPRISPGEKEKSVALWAYRNGQMAGRGTETLSSSEFLYLPLKTGARAVGVMGIKMDLAGEELAPERRRLLEAFSNQAALAIERAVLAREAEQAQLHQATERLERSLLNSISHDLRTPLSSIMGTLSSLREEGNAPGDESRRELLDLAWEEAERMNRFVGNLLDITRLEAGVLKIKKEPYDLQDLLGSCLASLESRLKGRKVKIQVPPDLPLIPMDSVLMAQVLINLLENALKYSPPDGIIEVSGRVRETRVEIEVADQGPGIPQEFQNQIFNKFFRFRRTEEVGGTGLGLAISKGIVEAHQGKIWAENLPQGGFKIVFALPIAPPGGGI
ncbi:MAG TPA: sensor histidine kinase KdpD [Thermodesulfobacteriota bacterium]|nr:sensor histidine kinase KdpD [Thermodesulfobacteriota bacterium]